jgi:acyl carrier protein
MVACTCEPESREKERNGEKMEIQKVEEKVRSIVCEKLAVEQEKVTMSASFIEDLGADSLDFVELVMEMEEEFKLNIPEEEATKLRTVGDVVQFISKTSSQSS